MNVQKPAYQLYFEYRPEFLVARVTGETDSVDISVRYFGEIVDECKARDYKKVLIIEDIKEKTSIVDIYSIVSYWSEMARGIKGAFVDLQSEHFTNNQFGELVAVNRGVMGRIFLDIPSAEEWLKED